MCKKRTLSLILTLALIVGCFTGTGITVKATDDDVELESITLSPESLGSQGGTVQVIGKGKNLPATLYYRVGKVTGINPPTFDWGEWTTATVSSSTDPTFTAEIPSNTESEAVTYRVQVNTLKGTSFAKSQNITVAASDDSAEPVDKAELEKVIADAKSRTEQDYEAAGWAAMQKKLQAAQDVNNKEEATAEEVKAAH